MVTAKVIKTEFSYPVFSVFVNFSDDAGTLAQPQTQQITFSAETLTGLDATTLGAKIKEYIVLYEEALAKKASIATEINKEFDNKGEIIK